MRNYVKHSTPERLRLRHPVFGDGRTRALALGILQEQPGIAGIRQGPESFLLLLEPEARPDEICNALEEKITELGSSASPVRLAEAGRRKNPYRKEILKAYLATGITTVTLAALGLYHWHAFFGWVFTAFAIDHVWVRRKAL